MCNMEFLQGKSCGDFDIILGKCFEHLCAFGGGKAAGTVEVAGLLVVAGLAPNGSS